MVENGISILDPRLSKTGALILEEAVKLSRKYGSGVATIESLYASLINHPAISEVARENNLDPNMAVSFVSYTRPQGTETGMHWDREISEAIDEAYQEALKRGAKKAGLVDLLSIVANHEVVGDIYFRSPSRLEGLSQLTRRFSTEQCYRTAIAS